MRKILNLIGLGCILLFSCQNEDNTIPATTGTGDLVAKIVFEASPSAIRATSTAIPATGWSNVKNMQLFLYYPESTPVNGGKVAFSAIIDPASVADGATKTFKWTDIPEGTYDLAIMANINSNTQNVGTSLNGGTSWVSLNQHNVRDKKINSEVFVDLKKVQAMPTGHTFPASIAGYMPSSEIFTAYAAGVKIEQGKEVVLSGTDALKLKREVSLMRILIDKGNKSSAPKLDKVNFAHANNFIGIQTLPVGLGVKFGTFGGGIYATPSKENRIMIAATGVGTYNTANPTAGYSPNQILSGNYSMWKDIMIYPNAEKAKNIAINGNAEPTRRYTVIISGRVPKDYQYADGSVATADNQPVYWSGNIKGVFSPNVIREVNLVITSSGEPVIPNPQKEGSLTISISTPEAWNSNIQSEKIEI